MILRSVWLLKMAMKNFDKKNVPRGEAANRAKAKYNAKAYDVFQVVMPKGQKDQLSSIAEKLGYKSRNEFVSEAISEKIDRETDGGSL